jgi:predicted dehydrogenase
MTVHTALVGCGAIAEIIARRSYRDSENCRRNAATIDPDSDRTRLLAEITGALPFPDLGTAIRNVHVDSVDLRAPNHLHVPLANDALERNLHVLVEKRAATT